MNPVQNNTLRHYFANANYRHNGLFWIYKLINVSTYFEMKKRLFRSALITFLLLFSACKFNDKDNFRDMLLPEGHASSCWLDIVPGLTTYEEGKNIISTYYGDDYVELVSRNSKIIQWHSEDDVFVKTGNVTFSDGITYDLFIFFQDKIISIDEFIHEIGDPYSVSIVIGDGCAGASLYYPDIGLKVFPTNYNGIIDSEIDQYITGLYIVEPWDPSIDPWTDSLQIKWQGYGDYCPEKWPWEE